MTPDGFSIFIPKATEAYLTPFTLKYGLYPRDAIFYLLAGVITGTINLPHKKLSRIRKLWKDESDHWFQVSGEALEELIIYNSKTEELKEAENALSK